MIFVVRSAIVLYSPFVLDRDMIFCFLTHHDIKLGPKKTAKITSGLSIISSFRPIRIGERTDHGRQRSPNEKGGVHSVVQKPKNTLDRGEQKLEHADIGKLYSLQRICPGMSR
jgi:hypothetical protein